MNKRERVTFNFAWGGGMLSVGIIILFNEFSNAVLTIPTTAVAAIGVVVGMSMAIWSWKKI